LIFKINKTWNQYGKYCFSGYYCSFSRKTKASALKYTFA
jgi:hypothetical protein